MKKQVTFFGANGMAGKDIVKALLTRGYTVVCAVRRPEVLDDADGIVKSKIDLSDARSLRSAIDGSDVVISALGTGDLKGARESTTLYSESTRAFRAAMRECGVKRLFVLSSGGVVEEEQAPWFYNMFIRRYIMNTYIDMARMEPILEESPDLEWTSVRLTYLQTGTSKPYLVENDKLGKGTFKINTVDVAEFIAQEIEDRRWIRMTPVLGYP